MFNKDNSARASKDVDTIIGKNSLIEGNISCEGSLRVDGRITGNVKASSNLYIGKEAAVKGNVEAADIDLSGTIEGNVASTGILKIHSTAKLLGDIEVKGLVADEGGIFQGSCKMVE